MCERYQLRFTHTFLRQVLSLPATTQQQIERRTRELQENPHSDGSHKQRLERYPDVYRLKVNKYRVFYRIRDCGVDLLAVEHRKDAYRQEQLPESADYIVVLEDPDSEELATRLTTGDGAEQTNAPATSTEGTADGVSEHASTESRPLARPISPELLQRLRIESVHWPALLECATEDGFLRVLGTIPERQAQRLLDAVCGQPLDPLLDESTYVVGEGETLEGLIAGRGRLRLDLDPQQLQVLEQIRSQSGPFIVTGGPGTGKTVVALYAAGVLLERLRADGVREPRLLYVTYTRTLASTAHRILRELLETRDWLSVSVVTLDQEVQRLWGAGQPGFIEQGTLRQLIRRARHEAFTRLLSPDPREDQRLAQSLRGPTDLYLIDEIEEVIVGRGLRSLDEYLAADRTGRRLPLNETQRRAIWRVYEHLSDLLLQEDVLLSSQRRLHALDLVVADPAVERYDAVIADEVQDFDLVGLRLLAALCRDRRFLVLVGDSGQSLYQRTFRWKLVEQELGDVVRLRLTTGHRCPPEIVQAARAYLAYVPGSEADGDLVEAHRKRAGKAGPLRILVEEWGARIPLPHDQMTTVPAWSFPLIEALREQRESLRVPASRCAVLAPTNEFAADVSSVLHLHGESNELVTHGRAVTSANSVKVLTWHNAKGLEFDLVVVLLPDWEPPPVSWSQVPAEEVRESVEAWRRVPYVAMSRATRSLVVVCPAAGTSPLLDGFSDELWESRRWSAGPAVSGRVDLPF
ncbi:AAA family ATPase [Thermomicrobiaceae bacterium CFH 74404]|uniref:DNA 3'-5' helicase n=1 Tax=Thermalbibacter longus TaxID=2951981 RepID=A0AA42BAC0_9BACT|nr:UvrD-helicase domain-containing protein [Thermalbibacter longus]MCM8749686.1 AAA family ATPase [Thermalbibacter longus]